MSKQMVLMAERVKDAQKRLVQQAKTDYPRGTLVEVVLGGAIVILEAIGHNEYYWSGAGNIYGRNMITGKNRTFNPVTNKTKIIPRPKKERGR